MWNNRFYRNLDVAWNGPTRVTPWKFRPAMQVDIEKWKPMQPFNIDKYLGCWYQYARTKNIPFQSEKETKVKVEYEKIDIFRLKVTNTSYCNDSVLSQACGVATFAGKNDVGSLRVSFPESQGKQEAQIGGNYNVLFTDYDTYSVVYSENETCGLMVWILYRHLDCDQDLMKEVMNRTIAQF